MTPTNKLRFVERNTNDPNAPRTLKILQQWWEDTNPLMRGLWKDGHGGEWRDVPTEQE